MNCYEATDSGGISYIVLANDQQSARLKILEYIRKVGIEDLEDNSLLAEVNYLTEIQQSDKVAGAFITGDINILVVLISYL